MCVSPPGRGGKYVWYLYRCVPPSATFTRDLGWTGRACSTMSRVGRYERGTYVLCVRLGAGSAHGVRALYDAEGELHACRISDASQVRVHRATRSIVDVQPRLTARAASSAPAFRGPTLPPWVFGYLVESVSHGHGPPRHVPLCLLPATSPWFMLAHPHYGWPEQLVSIPPGPGRGGKCDCVVVCIGVSLRVRPLRETSKRSIRLESFGNARKRKGDLFKAHSAKMSRN